MSHALNYGAVGPTWTRQRRENATEYINSPPVCFVTFLTNIILHRYVVPSAAKIVHDLLNVSKIWNTSVEVKTYTKVSETLLWMYWGKMSARGHRPMQVCFWGVFKTGLIIVTVAHLAGLPGAPPWSR